MCLPFGLYFFQHIEPKIFCMRDNIGLKLCPLQTLKKNLDLHIFFVDLDKIFTEIISNLNDIFSNSPEQRFLSFK